LQNDTSAPAPAIAPVLAAAALDGGETGDAASAEDCAAAALDGVGPAALDPLLPQAASRNPQLISAAPIRSVVPNLLQTSG
jgi:hypothetical protein